MTLKEQDGKNLEYGGAGGMVETSVGGAVAGTGSAGGLAGGSGWSGEGVVVGGAGGAGGMAETSAGGVVAGTGSAGGLVGGSVWGGEGVVAGGAGGAIGEPDGSTGSTGCNCTGCIGEGDSVEELSFVREEVEALPLYVAIEGAGEVAGDGAGRQWEMGDNCSSSSSSGSLSHSSSASHRRQAAFRVRLASGEAVVAAEGASGGVGDGWDVCMARCTKNRWRLRVGIGGSRGTVAPATATTQASWRAGDRRWSTQAAGD
jgi:hypothetical protein